MTIYVSHATSFDFKTELYLPIRNSHLNNKHNFILPHENSSQQYNTKGLFQSGKCDLVLSECSYPSTGQGIELGWADMYGIPIFCIYKVNLASKAFKTITGNFSDYTNTEDMLKSITNFLNNM